MYIAGVNNTKADALTRRKNEIASQKDFKAQLRTKALLHHDQVDPRILEDLGEEVDALDLYPLEDNRAEDTPFDLLDQIF